MKRAAIAGFAAGAAMMIGGALGAVSNSDPKPTPDSDSEVMNPMIGGQAMLPDRDIMENMAASPMRAGLKVVIGQHSSAGPKAVNQDHHGARVPVGPLLAAHK